MEALKELLLLVWDWLVANPPWFIGMVAAIAVLLWWLLHVRPEVKAQKQCEQKLLEGLQRTQQDDETQQKIAQAGKESAGRAFELRTMSLLQDGLSDWLAEGRAKLLHNIKIPYAQIDLLLIDTSGIYVIECKCWSGIVLGRQGWPHWLRVSCPVVDGLPSIEHNDQFFKCQAFRSPIEENKDHQKKLYQLIEKHTGRRYTQFKQLSVFDKCGNLEFLFPSEIKPTDYRSQYTWFGSKDEFLDKICWYDCAMQDDNRLSQQEVNELYEMLKQYVEPSETPPVRELDYPKRSHPLPTPSGDSDKESLHDRLARAKEESALRNAELQRQRQRLGLEPPLDKRKNRDDRGR